jgi:hypothetical protein
MFDGITNQQTYEFFQKNFKQTNVESVTTFYIKYQVQVQKLLARKIWLDDSSLNFNEVSFFRSKLRQDISLQTALILQQQDTDNSSLTIDKVYKTALLAEKIVQQTQSSGTTALAFQTTKDNGNRSCFYCGKSGHTIKECGDKKRNRKPCQRYIDSGIKRFGPEYEWDRNKLKQRNLKKPVQLLMSDDNEQDQDPISVIMATQAPKQEKSSVNYPRTVAMISVDLKNHEGDWYNNMTTLIDSCGCENGINSNFAQMHGFQIQTDTDKGPSAISACGGGH